MIKHALAAFIPFLCAFAQDQDDPGDGKKASWKRCGSEIRWIRNSKPSVTTFDEAVEKARNDQKLLLWYIPHLNVGGYIHNLESLDRYLLTGPFSDPELSVLINRKFTPLYMPSGGEAAKIFGIKPFKYMEPCIAVCTPDKKLVHVLHRIRTFDTDYFMWMLRKILADHPEYNSPSASARKAKEELDQNKESVPHRLSWAAECVMDGDYDAARATLDSVSETPDHSAPAHFLRALLAKRNRNAREALRHLEKARKGSDEERLARILTESGVVLARVGENGEAAKILEEVVQKYPRSEAAPQAAYFLGALRFLNAADDEATRIWSELRERYPESIWACKADANLAKAFDSTSGVGAFTHSMQILEWPSEDAFKLESETVWKRAMTDKDDIVRRAVKFLIASQRADGSWRASRYINERKPGILDNVWMATSAVCAAALAEYRDASPDAIGKALDRADGFFLKDGVHRGKNGAVGGKYDEWSYADAYRLLYFSKRIALLEDADRKAKIKEFGAELIRNLAQQQGTYRGFFAHEYPNPFCSATVIFCLSRAKGAGFEVPEEMLAAAAERIASVRGKEGTFAYGAGGRGAPKKSGSSRAALCQYAMLLAGRGEKKDVSEALDLFLKYHDQGMAIARKSDCHCPPLDAVAGFFYWHNFYPACEAAKACAQEGDDKRPRLFEIIVSIPEIDGTFIDGHEMGKPYGTAMALLSIQALDSK
ncbi:MAG: hypothetical protein HY716_00245 [Planctomycetes bacterium]|nr:hypothetical protein [Planctomycetota bacterium]